MSTQTLPPNRQFGIVIGIAILVIGWFVFSLPMRLIAPSSAAFVVLGLFNSQVLTPLNKAWMTFGFILAKVMNPLVLGILYFLLLTPVAIFLKKFGRDELNLTATTSVQTTHFSLKNKSENKFNFDDQF